MAYAKWNLRDIDGAIGAWKQLPSLDRADEAARAALTRLLEKSQRWDDLASLLEQEATAEPDPEAKIALEKKLANLQESKRKDYVAAAEAWTRTQKGRWTMGTPWGPRRSCSRRPTGTISRRA